MSTPSLLSACLVLASLALASAFQVKDCTGPNPSGKLKSILISSCPDGKGDYCPLIKGQDTSIEVEFDSLTPFSSAKIDVHGKIGPVSIKFRIDPDEACGNYGFNCPVEAHSSEKLKLTLPIKALYPKVNVTINMQLKDERANSIFCLEFPARIVDSS